MHKAIFNIQSTEEFKEAALQVFKHQFKNNKVYRSFCDLINVHPSDVHKVAEIPFLPIQFFKTREVLSSKAKIHTTFTSSELQEVKQVNTMLPILKFTTKVSLKALSNFTETLKTTLF